MMAKDRSATYRMNIAIEGAHSCVAVLKQNDTKPEAREALLKKASEYLDEARDALVTISFHRNQI